MLTPSKRLFDHLQIGRFGLVGLINTGLGYAVIVIALALGAGDVPANAAGYAAGLGASYFLNSRWTLGGGAPLGWGSAARYAAVFAIAYAANLAIVLLAGQLGYREDPLVHLIAVVAYSTLFYAGMVTFVSDDRPIMSWRNIVRGRWPEILMLATLAAAWWAMRSIPVSHDIVWQMWIARQLLGGATLYQDILEVNPPLWFWLALPVQKAAQVLGMAPQKAIVSAIFIYAVVAQLLFAALIAELSPRRRAWLLAVGAIAAIILPLKEFAQREQIALIAAIPYCALAARRAEGRDVPWWLAAAIGLFSAVGFALKHYFIAPLVVLELWVLWRRRPAWHPFRPELLMLLAAALLYAAAMYVWAPAYMSTMVPMVTLACFGYESTLQFQLLNPFVFFWVIGGCILFVLRSPLRPLTAASIVATVGFAFSYFVQQKGFNYHTLPATGLLFLAFGSMLPVDGGKRVSTWLIACATAVPIVFAKGSGLYRNWNEEVITALLSDTKRGTPVMMFSAHPSSMWPMVENQGYVWPSRHFGMWMLAAFAKQMKVDGQLSPPMQELAREVRAQTVVDLQCHPPEVIIVHDTARSKASGIDIIAFFSQDEEFRRFFANYVTGRVAMHHSLNQKFTSYIKRPGWQPAAPAAGCRTVH